MSAAASSTGAGAPGDGPVPASLPLAGRDQEIAALRTAIDAARAGRGSTMFLAGESGVGKTRLAEAARDLGEQQGFATATGLAFPVEVGMPYAPWADALQPILRALEPAQLTVLTRGGTELAQILPQLEGVTRAVRAPEGNPAEVKSRLHWSVGQFLTRLAERRPLLLVLENLQWADAASLELLHFIARQVGDCRILLLCTYTDTVRGGTDALRATEKSLVSLGLARTHRLSPITSSALHEILRALFGSGDPALSGFCDQLYSWTRGLPFFIDQTLKSLVESGHVYQRNGVWQGWAVDALPVPLSVKDILLDRLRRLPPRARTVVDLTATNSARMSFPVLQLTSRLEREELLAAIDEVRSAQILVESDDRGEVVYDIVHPMLRQVVVEDLGLARARLLHRTIAQALERLYGDRSLEHADELAFHFLRSGAMELAAKTARYLVSAGRSALAKSANREAATYLATALRLHDDAGDGGLEDVEWASVVEALAQAHQRNGEFDAAFALLERARDAAQTRGDAASVAGVERRMGLALYWRGRRDEALSHYQAALNEARRAADDGLVARLLLTRGVCFIDLGDPEQAERDVSQAREIAEAVGDRLLLARAHRALLLLYVMSGRAALAHEHGDLTLQYAKESGLPAIAWSAHWAKALLSGLTGDFGPTLRHLDEAERLAEELRSPALQLRTAEMRVGICYMSGEWERAIAIGEQTLALARTLGHHWVLARLCVYLGLVYLGRDELGRARELMDEAWELSGAGRPLERKMDVHSVIAAHMGRASYHVTSGEYDQAVAVARAGAALADAHGLTIWAIFRLLPVMLEALLQLQRFDEAEHYGQRLARESEQAGHRLGMAWARAARALVDTLRGTTRAALLRVEESADELEQVPNVFDSARLRREIARRWVELGERENALRSLRRAHEVFVRLGAAGELQGTREQIRELGARPPSPSAGQGAAGLSARELEIVRRVAARKSNKEIGRELGISARTVSTHLSNIFGKAHVTSRGELADFARSQGLLEQ